MRNRYLVLGLSIVLALALAVPALGGPTNPVATISASVKSVATKALKKAKAAQKKANAAQAAANAAQATANAANTAAGKAQTSANSGIAAADKAQKAAEAAQASANAAQASADSKLSSTNFEDGEGVSGEGEDAIAAAGCPAGESPSGGGFVLNGTDSDKVRVDLNSQYLNGWIVSADNIAGHAGESWELSAVAICIG